MQAKTTDPKLLKEYSIAFVGALEQNKNDNLYRQHVVALTTENMVEDLSIGYRKAFEPRDL